MSSSALVKKQRGNILPTALFVLLFIAILGVSSVNQTSDQLRVANYQQDYQLAFQAAEAGLRYGERLVMKQSNPVTGHQFIGPDWDGSGGSRVGELNNSQLLAESPSVYISEFDTMDYKSRDTTQKQTVYVITSRATGRDPDTVVILRSYYRP